VTTVSSSPSSNHSGSPTTLNKSSPYAYAFVLGGCDPASPKYRGYLYGIYVSVYLLQKFGSRADFILFVELYHEYPYDKLPTNELEVLRKLNVNIKTIPKAAQQSFYRLQLNKFRILGLTQYRRVLYLDADVMPTANLDFLFEYSDTEVTDPPFLRENVVVRGEHAPVNGGFFMLTPLRGDLERINDIIGAKEMRIRDAGAFDPVAGWGHPIEWRSKYKNGTTWNFYAADGDQGLLFHWTMHVKRTASLFVGRGKVEDWGTSITGSDNEDKTSCRTEADAPADQAGGLTGTGPLLAQLQWQTQDEGYVHPFRRTHQTVAVQVPSGCSEQRHPLRKAFLVSQSAGSKRQSRGRH